MAKVVRWLFVIVGALLGVVVVLSLIRGAPLIEMVPLMLVLLMSAVPVALPVMFTVSMAVGSGELAKRGVLVTRLSAAEDAATMDVLCVDKTGTITMNQLAVTGVIPLEHATESDVLFAGALASQEANQDPIDLAFLGRGERPAHLRRRSRGHAGLVHAVRCEEPADGSRGRTEWAAAARDERGGANHRRGLRARRPRRSRRWRPASAKPPPRAIERWPSRAAPRPARPHWSGW